MGALYDLAFPRFRPPRGAAKFDERAVSISWLGTAAHVVSTKKTTVLLDPYVSRHDLRSVATRTISPDERAIEKWIPKKVDAILCGHSHYDHLLDAPRIAIKTGAKLVGSRTTCSFARAAGVPESQLVMVPPTGASIEIADDLSVRFVPSLHGKIAFGRVPFPGEVESPPKLPARAWQYKMGGAFGIILDAAGVRIYHNGSADLIDAEIAGERVDVLIAGLAGRQATRDYLKRLLALEPDLVIPTHHDAFFAPLESGLRLLPGIDIDGFVSEVRAHAPRARIGFSDYGENIV